MYSESRKIVLYQQIQLLYKKVFCVTVVKLKEDLGKYFLDIIKVQCWVLFFWRVLEQTATLLCNSLTPYFIASFESDVLRQSVNSRIKGKFGHKLWRKKKKEDWRRREILSIAVRTADSFRKRFCEGNTLTAQSEYSVD